MTEEKTLMCEWAVLSLWRGLFKASWPSINVLVPHWVCMCVCEAQGRADRKQGPYCKRGRTVSQNKHFKTWNMFC